MLIRLACQNDVNAIKQCVDNAYQHYINRMGKPPGPMLDDYQQCISSNIVYVGELDYQIVGVLVLIESAGAILLDNIAILNSYQSQGLGGQLLHKAHQVAIAKGYDSIELYTNELMHENIGYYQKKGYVITHRIKEKGYHRIYMSRLLR